MWGYKKLVVNLWKQCCKLTTEYRGVFPVTVVRGGTVSLSVCDKVFNVDEFLTFEIQRE